MTDERIHMLMKPDNRGDYIRYAAAIGCSIEEGEVYAPTIEHAKLLFKWIRENPSPEK